jgi:chorismate mutase
MQSNYFIAPDPLSLDRIRNVLTRLEDSILFQLIERAQFAYNPRMYTPGAFPELVAQGFEGTWLDWFLKEIETFHGTCNSVFLRQIGNLINVDGSKGTEIYEVVDIIKLQLETNTDVSDSPDEYPFSSGLPDPVLKSLSFPKILYPNDVNANPAILSFYTKNIIPALTRQASDAITELKRSRGINDSDDLRDDGNYGSAATLDVELLQTISKRVHYGESVIPYTNV